MIIHTEKQLLEAGANLARVCTAPFIIYLKGPLGAGKTTLSRGFIGGKGHQGKVKSPTYTIVECYNDQETLYHFDFYRINDPEELELIGIREYFNQHSVCLIEWPELGKDCIPSADLICELKIIPQGRELKIVDQSLRGASALKSFLTNYNH